MSYSTPTGHCAEDGDSIYFVDDGTVIYSHKDTEVISQVISNHYKTITNYMAANKFAVNDDKTHLLVMAPRRLSGRREEVMIQAEEFTIKPSWNHHIRDDEGSILKQLVSRVNGLKKLASKAVFQPKLMIANGIVMIKLSYGLAMWGNCQGYLKKALQVQQLKANRAVCGYRSYYWSTRQLLTTCGWLSVNKLNWQQVMITTVNIQARMLSRHATRAAAGVSQGYGNQLVNQSFNQSERSYNNLPAKPRESSSLASFKRQLRTWVLNNITM